MKILAKQNRELIMINAQNTQNENDAEKITLQVPEQYEDFNKKIVFVTPAGNVWDIITNNEYLIKKAITKYKQVDFYIWLTKGDVDFRSQTKTLKFYHNVDASDEITNEEIGRVNTVINLLEEEITKVDNLETELRDLITDIQNKLDNGEFDGEDGYTPQKGIDYFTEQDIEEIETDVKNDLEENVLVNYSLIAETGAKIELSINTTDYKLKAILKDKNNNIIHTSNVIDLPLETMVVNATYDNINKAIILTLQNGTTVSISVADLVSGLVSESQLQTILANYYTQTEINNLLANKVDKVAGKGLSTNDFTDEYKEQIDTNTEDIEDIQEEQTEQNTEIEKLQAENARLKATLPTTTGEGQAITLNKTAELEFVKPPLPMGNSEQDGEPSPTNEVPINNVTGDLEVKVQNKNFLDLTKKPYSESDSTLNGATVVIENGTMTVSASSTGAAIVRSKWEDYRSSNSIYLPAGSYYTELKLNISGVGQFSGAFTLNEPGYITQWFVSVSQNTTMRYKLQIEQGSTASPYTPHQEQVLPLTLGNIELCKIGDYQDYFYKSGSKWYLHKEIGKVVLDGTENWEARGTSTTLYQLAQTGIKHPTENNKKASLVSNFFETLAYYVNGTTDIFGNNNGISYPAIDNLLLIKNLSVNSLETFKAWLNEHNTKVYYTLATATNTEITDTTLISQLEAINDALSYEEQTNISSNQNAIFNVEAYQSTKLVLEERDAKYESLEARVALLE